MICPSMAWGGGEGLGFGEAGLPCALGSQNAGVAQGVREGLRLPTHPLALCDPLLHAAPPPPGSHHNGVSSNDEVLGLRVSLGLVGRAMVE